MGWIQKLYETYNNCLADVGNEPEGGKIPLLPVGHTTQMAHIEIAIDGEGVFRRARVVPKEEARTIIPCTEASGGRTSGEAPHPLCDKLQYVAGDYAACGGSKAPYFDSYTRQLQSWSNSQHAHPKVTAVQRYTAKQRVIRDLMDSQVLAKDEAGMLIQKWDKKAKPEAPEIFNVLTAADDAFVRWLVETPGDPEPRTWRDETLWENWIAYYFSTKADRSLCYVTGDETLVAEQSPAKLIHDGDKAKLISANDQSGFTFRGRFLTSEQAATIGYEATQKSHHALRWLISRQGYRESGMAIVAWATSGAPVPKPTDDPLSILGMDQLPEGDSQGAGTAQEVGLRLKKRIAGYGSTLGDKTNVVVMGLDSATPGQGRMAVTYYQELSGSDYLRRIDTWHETCAWTHNYRVIWEVNEKTGKKKKTSIPFTGAPAPADIAKAAYSERVDDRLKAATVARILPCIIEGRPLPRDLVESTARRASNRAGQEAKEWEKTLSIACALYRKYHKEEDYKMALDPERKTRDYLYGRLLALAESLEDWALDEAGEKRQSNAARLMQRFAEHPHSTWRTLELALAPYKARLGDKANKRLRMVDEVVAAFEDEDFLNDRRLSGEFLLGYHNQREALRPKTNKTETTDEDEA
ncbi:MAG: type I-C CRISPR-associated protein Cas8c/Csd1 [Anaerolineae bacterium]|nr:type I-C CRISPR-associated protein Cas8c/Csd1 [Anaerolineae bacterium]